MFRFSMMGALCGIVFSASACQQLETSNTKSSALTVASTPTAADQATGGNVLIAYYSRSGNTEKVAKAIESGARGVEGVNVSIKPAANVSKADLVAADGIIVGTATHYANIPGEMKTIIDNWAYKERINFTDKVGGAFSTGGNLTGGKEHVVISLLLYMLNNRMMVVGPICKEGDGGWGEIGASATTGFDDPGLSDAELAAASKLGKRVAEVVRRRVSKE